MGKIGRDLIKRIKPLLSYTGIVNMTMTIRPDDVAILSVDFMVNDEILGAIGKVESSPPPEEFKHYEYRCNQTHAIAQYILSKITKWPTLDISNFPKNIFTHGYTLEICREPSVVDIGDTFRKVIMGSDKDVYFLVNGKRIDYSDWSKHKDLIK